MVTPDAFHRQLGALGLPLRENGDYFGYSLALGSAEVPLLHLTNAFRSLANGGRFSPWWCCRREPARRSPGAGCARAAFIVGDILQTATPAPAPSAPTACWPPALLVGRENRHQQRHARQLGGGLVRTLHRGRVGGQCQRRCDARCERHQRAAPVWAAVMGFLHAREPSRPPRPPQGLVQWPVRFGPAGAMATAPRRHPAGGCAPSGLCQARSSLCLLSIT